MLDGDNEQGEHREDIPSLGLAVVKLRMNFEVHQLDEYDMLSAYGFSEVKRDATLALRSTRHVIVEHDAGSLLLLLDLFCWQLF